MTLKVANALNKEILTIQEIDLLREKYNIIPVINYKDKTVKHFVMEN